MKKIAESIKRKVKKIIRNKRKNSYNKERIKKEIELNDKFI